MKKCACGFYASYKKLHLDMKGVAVMYGNLKELGIDVPIMLSVEEAHIAYRLSKQFLYGLAKSGKIKAVSAGEKFLLSAESLSDYLRNGSLTDDEPTPTVGGIRRLG